jgi:hypothetical protein
MGNMRSLTYDFRLQALSLPEIVAAIEGAATDLGAVKLNGRKLKAGPLINAIVLHFLSLDDAGREAMARAGVERLQALMRLDEPSADEVKQVLRGGETPEPTSGPARRKVTGQIEVNLPDDPPKKGRGKRGNRNSG